jgi:hypothetical protein
MSSGQIRTRTRDTVLVDELRTTPVDEALSKRQRRWSWSLLLVLVLVGLYCLLPSGGVA